MRFAGACLITLLVVFVFYVADVTTLAGAHPQWALQLAVSGIVLGTGLAALILRVPFVLRTVALSVLAICAYVVARYGKGQFAASFAEDAFAGQLWFFGWHVLSIAMVAHLVCASYAQLSAWSDRHG